jgi:hypothetical protein
MSYYSVFIFYASPFMLILLIIFLSSNFHFNVFYSPFSVPTFFCYYDYDIVKYYSVFYTLFLFLDTLAKLNNLTFLPFG